MFKRIVYIVLKIIKILDISVEIYHKEISTGDDLIVNEKTKNGNCKSKDCSK